MDYCECNPDYPNGKPYRFTLPANWELVVSVFFSGGKELGVRIFSEDRGIDRWMRNRVLREGPGEYTFETSATPRHIIICGASKDCFEADGCPDRDWDCGYQVGSEIIHIDNSEERRIEVNWDDSRPEGRHKNISVILNMHR